MKALVLIFLSLAQFRESRSTDAPGATTTIPRPLRFELEYTLIVANSPDCPSFQAYPPPQLQYREGPETEWTTLTNMEMVDHTNFTTSKRARVDVSRFVLDLYLQLNGSQELQDSSQFHFVQMEHRGGFCDCWAVANLTLSERNGLNMQCGKRVNLEEIFETSPNKLPGYDHDDIIAGFCRDSALIPREFIAVSGITNSPAPTCTTVPRFTTPQTDCGISDTRIEVSFDLRIQIANCDGIDDFSEGAELSFRSVLEDGSTTDWIPLMFFAPTLEITQPYVWLIPTKLRGNNGNFNLRGYNVAYTIQSETASSYNYSISMCGGDILRRPLQFRWLHNSYQVHPAIRDVVLLDNVTIRLKNSTHYAILLEDCFDYSGSIIESYWNLSSSYNIHLDVPTVDTGNRCHQSSIVDRALFFYPELSEDFFSLNASNGPYSVNSRQLVTNFLDLSNVEWSHLDQGTENVLTCEPPDLYISTTTIAEVTRTTTLPEMIGGTTEITNVVQSTVPETTATITTTEVSPTTVLKGIRLAVIDSREGLSSQIQALILALDERYTTLVLQHVNSLLSFSPECDVNLTATVSILSLVVMNFGNQIVEKPISELVLSIGSRMMEIARTNCATDTKDDPPEVLDGSTLLQVIDTFALSNHNVSYEVTSDNIKFLVKELKLNETIDDSEIRSENAMIHVPIREILSSSRNNNPVRMASLLFRNMSGLLPERLHEETGINRTADDLMFRLASPVISASFRCDTCTTSNLSTPVQVTFKHTPYDQALLESDPKSSIMCVFWVFDEQEPGAILYPGRWSEEGCETNFNSTMTVCKCNHLTHFAILLSAQPLDLNLPLTKLLSLQIIGYIGVSISLVAMAATIFIFLFLECKINANISKKRPLVTMRNYIHIQLCVTLAIAQIIFVAGIEPRLGEGHLVGGVPVGCRLVAVLLHYWFLVSFMWMLMEGVVLHVALVRVFISHHARYIAAFTIASYGLPLLYVGGLTIPLGFARSEEIRRNQKYDYGYEHACYLNPMSSFVWSLILPVILILLANIGFFIMTLIIKYKNQNRTDQHKQKSKQVCNWLKASISLTVVMGINWIIGFLVIEVEELFFLAYIFTIFVAFQGLFIFVIFVLLQKPVRDSYAKWWKATVSESDYLSKYFGQANLTSKLTPQGIVPSTVKSQEANVPASASEKFNLSQSEIITNLHTKEGAIQDEEEL